MATEYAEKFSFFYILHKKLVKFKECMLMLLDENKLVWWGFLHFCFLWLWKIMLCLKKKIWYEERNCVNRICNIAGRGRMKRGG